MTRVTDLFAIACCLALTCAAPAHAGTAAQQCEATKLKAAGKDASCRASARAKTIVGTVGDLTRCTTKLSSAFAKAEGKGGCLTSGDASAVDARVDTSMLGVGGLLNPSLALVDNGDGTITDSRTGLVWEKKVYNVWSQANVVCRDNLDCLGFGGACPPCLHCVNDLYTWTDSLAAGGVPNGTAFTSFLATLNGGGTGVGGCVSADGTSITGGFNGHCDWRLPTITELATLIDVTQP